MDTKRAMLVVDCACAVACPSLLLDCPFPALQPGQPTPLTPLRQGQRQIIWVHSNLARSARKSAPSAVMGCHGLPTYGILPNYRLISVKTAPTILKLPCGCTASVLVQRFTTPRRDVHHLWKAASRSLP